MTSKLTITDERLAELVAFKPLPGTDINSVTRDEWMAMAAELQERRQADSEPYGFTDGVRHGMIYKPEHSDRLSEPVPLYRHAQQPVVPQEQHWEELCREHPDCQRRVKSDPLTSPPTV